MLRKIIIFILPILFIICWQLLFHIHLIFIDRLFSSIAQPLIIFGLLVLSARKKWLRRREILIVTLSFVIINFILGPLENFMTDMPAEGEPRPWRKYFINPGAFGGYIIILFTLLAYWSVYSVKRIMITLLFSALYFSILHVRMLNHWGYIIVHGRLGPEVDKNITDWPIMIACDSVGSAVDIRTMTDKIVVIDVWSQYCAQCFKDFPVFEELKKSWAHDTTIVFYNIYIELGGENFEACDIKHEYDFTILKTDESFYESLKISGLPKYYIIYDGKMVYEGFKDQLNEYIEKYKSHPK